MKVLKRSNLPTRLPLWQSVVCLLALEHWNAPEWLYGVAGFLFLLLWIASIVTLIKEEQVDLLEKKEKLTN